MSLFYNKKEKNQFVADKQQKSKEEDIKPDKDVHNQK